MAVAGPNARLDFHYNETSEFFYQMKGTLSLFLQKNGLKVEERIGPGTMFLLDPKIPHLPVRPANSFGLVIEFKRNADHKDGLQWYCPECNTLIFAEYFALKDIEKDFAAIFDKFYGDVDLRTCSNCNAIHPIP